MSEKVRPVSRGILAALWVLTACAGGQGSDGIVPPEERIEALRRSQLPVEIRSRLETLIAKRGLPFEVTQVEFQEAGPEAREVNLPGGTWLVIQFEDPLDTAVDSGLSTADLALYKPLELYRDSLAPFFDEMDFVVAYVLSFRDPHQTVFQIDPFDLRFYIAGEITTKQMSKKITITSL